MEGCIGPRSALVSFPDTNDAAQIADHNHRDVSQMYCTTTESFLFQACFSSKDRAFSGLATRGLASEGGPLMVVGRGAPALRGYPLTVVEPFEPSGARPQRVPSDPLRSVVEPSIDRL